MSTQVAMPATPTAEDAMEGEVGPNRRRMPTTRGGITVKLEIMAMTGGVQEGYITANTNEDGTVGEIFLAGFGKSGSTLEGWVQLCAMLFSTALQYGAEFDVLVRKIAHTKFEPYGPTNHPDIPYCNSVPDFIVRWLALRFGTEKLQAEVAKIAEEVAHA